MVASKLNVLGNLLIPPIYLKFVHPVIEKSPSRKVSPKLAVAGRLKRLIKYYKMLTKGLEILSYLKSFQTILKEKAFKNSLQESGKTKIGTNRNRLYIGQSDKVILPTPGRKVLDNGEKQLAST